MEGRSVVDTADYWISADVMSKEDRQIRSPHFNVIANVGLSRGTPERNVLSPLPRKASKSIVYEPVPETDTGGWVEKTKANE